MPTTKLIREYHSLYLPEKATVVFGDTNDPPQWTDGAVSAGTKVDRYGGSAPRGSILVQVDGFDLLKLENLRVGTVVYHLDRNLWVRAIREETTP